MLAHDNIYTIEKIEHIMPFVSGNPGELIIFDIDDTLIRLTDPEASGIWYKESLERLAAEGKSEKEAKHILFQTHISAMYRTPVLLVDQQLPSYLSNFRTKRAKTLCLTAREGRCLLYATLRHLGDAQLDFAHTDTKLNEPVLFPELVEHDILYSSGILFTGGIDKGTILKMFFQKIDYYPHHIIFVDDIIANVRSVRSCAKSLDIDFDGFHFTNPSKSAPKTDHHRPGKINCYVQTNL